MTWTAFLALWLFGAICGGAIVGAVVKLRDRGGPGREYDYPPSAIPPPPPGDNWRYDPERREYVPRIYDPHDPRDRMKPEDFRELRSPRPWPPGS